MSAFVEAIPLGRSDETDVGGGTWADAVEAATNANQTASVAIRRKVGSMVSLIDGRSEGEWDGSFSRIRRRA
jgi:hypothetical protein